MTSIAFHTQRFDTVDERQAASVLPAAVRQSMVKNLLAAYPTYNERLKDIGHFHRPVTDGNHGTGELAGLLAPPRSGKSVICQSYASSKPKLDGEFGEIHPVVLVQVRDDWTPSHMCEQIYRATGAMSVPSLKIPAMIGGAIQRLVDAQTELVIVDDAHFALIDTTRTHLRNYRSLFKGILDAGTCNVLLSGLPGLLDVVDAADQLGGRGGFPHWYVETLSWDIEEQREQFTLLLRAVDRRLPFRQSSELHSARNALHFFKLSDGMIGRVMNVVRDAANRAINEGAACVMDVHLQAAAGDRSRPGDTFRAFRD